MQHEFTPTILRILRTEFGGKAQSVFDRGYLLQYLNLKTRSATRGSKSRASFGNLYAIYVLVEDYIAKGFPGSGGYAEYEGARFSDLLRRQRQLPSIRRYDQRCARSDRIDSICAISSKFAITGLLPRNFR